MTIRIGVDSWCFITSKIDPADEENHPVCAKTQFNNTQSHAVALGKV